MSKLDRKGRPVSVMSNRERQAMLEQLLGIWNDHPRWGLGQLVSKVASVRSGVSGSVERISDADMQAGLDALVPLAWEVEEFGASPAWPADVPEPLPGSGSQSSV